MVPCAELDRLQSADLHLWRLWGPYLSERAWGTVREDYSQDGSAWSYFPHEHARSRAYRWNEDGLLGISDNNQYLCFALALWNGQDPILKERLFGVTGAEGNHGEDVKECYHYLDSTPTHAYMSALYRYPQQAFPYEQLRAQNAARTRHDPEFELEDTGVFEQNRFFDITVEYAKADFNDIVICITATNRAAEAAPLWLLPQLWFRNRWSWNPTPGKATPWLSHSHTNTGAVSISHPQLGNGTLTPARGQHPDPRLLFTGNDTNISRVFGGTYPHGYWKDAFHEYVINEDLSAVNPAEFGTKAGLLYQLILGAGETRKTYLRLRVGVNTEETVQSPEDLQAICSARKCEADRFFDTLVDSSASQELKEIQRQAIAGLLWSKQYYHYNVKKWLDGDALQPAPPKERHSGRNARWQHLDAADVILMPDAWEYPWFASWDLAFHCVSVAIADPQLAKDQLLLLLREWYMHPNGQLPAYEWALGDVNPPVHAWAAMRLFQIDRRITGSADYGFLKRVFHKLLINFTWWVNRKDAEGRNVFQGGFLGLDNIGLFDRSAPLPTGGYLDQIDGTSWMAMYCLNMFAIAVELAQQDGAYEDTAVKFAEHFFYIASAMNDRPVVRDGDCNDIDLWDDVDGFYYDVIHIPGSCAEPMRIRSIAGLIPLLAIETISFEALQNLPELRQRIEWFLENRPDICQGIASVTVDGADSRRIFSVVSEEKLRKILCRMLDEQEFLSPYGIRSLSRWHENHPYCMDVNGTHYEIKYEPGLSTTGLFGGNSNWRGPVWFPLNYLLIEALQKLDYYYEDAFVVEFPTGSGDQHSLWSVSQRLTDRMLSLFIPAENGLRPYQGGVKSPDMADTRPVLFHEFYHADLGKGLGASHQTGWTALVAKMIQQSVQYRCRAR
jgi:Glycosyl hydrolase family 63 C-terminal domain